LNLSEIALWYVIILATGSSVSTIILNAWLNPLLINYSSLSFHSWAVYIPSDKAVLKISVQNCYLFFNPLFDLHFIS
jgi:hypothetical protein